MLFQMIIQVKVQKLKSFLEDFQATKKTKCTECYHPFLLQKTRFFKRKNSRRKIQLHNPKITKIVPLQNNKHSVSLLYLP